MVETGCRHNYGGRFRDAVTDRFCMNEEPYLRKNIWSVQDRQSDSMRPRRKANAGVFQLRSMPSMRSFCEAMRFFHSYSVETAMLNPAQMFTTVVLRSKYAISALSIKLMEYELYGTAISGSNEWVTLQDVHMKRRGSTRSSILFPFLRCTRYLK